MDAFLEKQMLVLSRELAASHGTFFAAALLADMNVSLPTALTALAYGPRPNSVVYRPLDTSIAQPDAPSSAKKAA